jgi:hypothetical protein
MQSQDSTDRIAGAVKPPDATEWMAFVAAKSRMAEALTQLNRLLKHANQDTPCNHRIQLTELRAL